MTQMMQHKGKFSGRVSARGAAVLFAILVGACGAAFAVIFYAFGLILG